MTKEQLLITRAAWPSGGRTPRGWNNGQGRASDSLHLVCFGWPSDSRRLTERDLMGDGVGLDLSARIAVTDFLRYSSPLSEQADRAAYDALLRGLRSCGTGSSVLAIAPARKTYRLGPVHLAPPRRPFVS